MNLLESLLGGQGQAALGQIAKQFGLNESQVRDVVSQLAPALGQGLQRNARASGGMDALIGALAKGNHGRYLDDIGALANPDTTADGNNILGHILGSKDVSRSLAGKAAEQTGVGADLIKKMLPLIASLAMGSLSKQTSSAGGGNPMSDVLGSLLDRNGDGSALDDLIGMAGSLFKR
ncbi:MAG: DUF937 domain-containing protein [Pseudomonadales bacterium]|nr:DUF937 domain-containing protein [Pseudomonadales bacterium]MCP5185694.1 DUF937 domain-containing protein [Pseudomonadales bacterium]